MGDMKEMEQSSTLFGANAPFIEELYEHYLASPDSVPVTIFGSPETSATTS